MWSGVQPSSSLWWTSAPYFTNNFTTSRFPVSTASCSAAIPAHRTTSVLCSHAVHSSEHWSLVDWHQFKFSFSVVKFVKSKTHESLAVKFIDGSLLTWVEECINTDLSCSHEATDLFQVSSSHNILENDVIGEVHSPLCRCHRYDRSRIFLCWCAPRWTVPWAFAVRGYICGCSLVSGCVVWWGVMCAAVLCWSVLGCRGICGCVVCWCIMRGSVIVWCVVRWCVMWSACVRRHWYMVVVLHHCNGLRVCLPLCCQPRRREVKNPKECTVQ